MNLPLRLLRLSNLRWISVLLVLLSACGQKSPPTVPPQTFRYAEPGVVRSLDPAKAQTRAERWLAAQLFNTLFEVGEDLNRYPALVKDYSWSGTTCLLQLRDEVYFHQPENRQLTARDVVFSLRRSLRLVPELAARTQLTPTRIQVAGRHQVSIEFEDASEHLLWWLTDLRFSIVLPEATQRKGVDFGKQPVGTGPFRFVHWYPDHSARLMRHPNYFRTNFRGHPLPELAGVYVSFVKDEAEIERRFRAGELDLCWPVRADSSLRSYTFSRELLAGYFLELDTTLSPSLRQQIMGRISRQALADSLQKPALRTYWPDFLPLRSQHSYVVPLRRLPTSRLDSLRFSLHADAASTVLVPLLRQQLRLRQATSEASQLRLRYHEVPYPDPAFWLLPHTPPTRSSRVLTGFSAAAFDSLQDRLLPLLLEKKTGLLNPEVHGLHLDATEVLRLERVGVTRKVP